MARRRKEEAPAGDPLWMVTFTDLTTLLLTFFVVLISMSQIDERRTMDYLVNTRGESGFGVGVFNPLSKEDKQFMGEQGVMDLPDSELESLREFLWENENEDIDMESNRYVAIISIGEDVLFPPGGVKLSARGKMILDRLIPQIKNLRYPMLVAGNTSTARDELGEAYHAMSDDQFSPTWKLSLYRALAVYEYFRTKNISAEQMTNEGFGQYRPKVSNNTPEGRKTNRRVDLVLDRRNSEEIDRMKRQDEIDRQRDKENIYQFKEFKFKLDVNQPQQTGQDAAPVQPNEQGRYQVSPSDTGQSDQGE